MLLVKKLLKYVVIVGLVSYVVIMVFNLNNQMFDVVNVNGITQYRFNYYKYLQNLALVNTNIDVNIETILPSRTWQDPGNNWLVNDFWDAIINNIAVVFDWLYMPINFLLYIIRLLGYVATLVLAVIGWPLTITNNVYDSQLIEALKWIANNLTIPYV